MVKPWTAFLRWLGVISAFSTFLVIFCLLLALGPWIFVPLIVGFCLICRWHR